MNGLLVDSDIILDIFLDDPKWSDWSEAILVKNSANSTPSASTVPTMRHPPST